ncbi:MAG: choice-of-anchor H family protein [Pseudomonadota bacterium]|nr:choice-of-anchor H family protein [Pseudomonadota bacterium]
MWTRKKTRRAILTSLLTLSVTTAFGAVETKPTDFRVSHTGSDAIEAVGAEILERARETTPVIESAIGNGDERVSPTRSRPTRDFALIATDGRTVPDLWITSVETELSYDDDDDGFYHAFTLRIFPQADWGHLHVNAEIYISYEGGRWEHHATTEPFTVYADEPHKGFVIGSILDLGFPRGYYDVLIEIQDADTGFWLNEIGPHESGALQQLPLEDRDRDTPPVVTVETVHGGGSFGPATMGLLLLGLGLSWLRRVEQ